MVEGPLLIEDALKSGVTLREIILRETLKSFSTWAASVSERLFSTKNMEEDYPIYVLGGSLFDELIQTENGREIIGVFNIMETSVDEWPLGDILILDRIQDPGNLGTIVRTADAAGFSGIIALTGTVDAFSPKVVRAAAGSIFRIPILYVKGAEDVKRILKELNLFTVAIDPRGDTDYYHMPSDRNVAIVVGNEGAGISKELNELSDMRAGIPMREGIESLNAAMAAGIAMYERVRRKCRND